MAIGDAWEEFLPESHREALDLALCMLVDDFLNDPEDEEPIFVLDLPPKYLLQYNGLFRRKFLVTMLTVGYKLALSDPPVPLLSCTAEELALHVLLEEAKDALSTEGITPDFLEFEDAVYQDDMDILILYDMSLDGIESTSIGDDMAYANLAFDKWFDPFLNAVTPVHPYAADDEYVEPE